MTINIFSTQITVNKKGSFFLKVVFEINRNKMSAAVRVVSSSFSSQKKDAEKATSVVSSTTRPTRSQRKTPAKQ